jgi:hypothetical protein
MNLGLGYQILPRRWNIRKKSERLSLRKANDGIVQKNALAIPSPVDLEEIGVIEKRERKHCISIFM